MITLDYRTDNPRWGISGIKYSSWGEFAFALGYLANQAHYRNMSRTGLIELHFESNDVQGAWGKEGRIQYYGMDSYLALKFADWYKAKSAGINNMTYRINSNSYMYSLVYDFGFVQKTYPGYTTADIFPPVQDPFDTVWGVLETCLINEGMETDAVFQRYRDGWNE